jgi:hypothetical protein
MNILPAKIKELKDKMAKIMVMKKIKSSRRIKIHIKGQN